ncbi:MAG TPA: V-type ATP synthase subunit D [Clostridiales bacterium]|nr:V-type ATP synthase subunit D [Clostridiales bacterium]
MAVLNVSPTRMELTRIKKQLMVAIKGHKLLKDKRDELMRQFLDMVRETKELRRRVEEKMMEINRGFALASSVMQREALCSALLMPKQSVTLQIDSKNIMGVDVPVFNIQQKSSNTEDALSYGYAFTSGDLDHSILTLAKLLPDLLALAEQEKAAQMLAAEIERTRRRVNALEYIMIPNYQDTIRFITMKLDENERSNLTRLMKVKDMMVEKQIETNRKRLETLAFE